MSSLSIRAGQKRLSVFFPPAIPPISLVFCVIASLRLQNLFSETHREMKWQNYEIDQIHSQPYLYTAMSNTLQVNWQFGGDFLSLFQQ